MLLVEYVIHSWSVSSQPPQFWFRFELVAQAQTIWVSLSGPFGVVSPEFCVIALFSCFAVHTPCLQRFKKHYGPPLAPWDHVPVCNRDGSYAQVQCDANQGECWCVDHNGEPLFGPSRRGIPDCRMAGQYSLPR